MTIDKECRFSSDGKGRLLGGYVGLALVGSALLFLLYKEFISASSTIDNKIIGAVAVIFALLVYHTYKAHKDWSRFGAVWLTLDPCPAKVGTEVGFLVLLTKGVAAGEDMELTMTALKLEWQDGEKSGREENWVEHEEELWQGRTTAQGITDKDGIKFQFRLAVPSNLPASRPLGNRPLSDQKPVASGVSWQLVIKNSGPVSVIERNYKIPMLGAE